MEDPEQSLLHGSCQNLIGMSYGSSLTWGEERNLQTQILFSKNTPLSNIFLSLLFQKVLFCRLLSMAKVNGDDQACVLFGETELFVAPASCQRLIKHPWAISLEGRRLSQQSKTIFRLAVSLAIQFPQKLRKLFICLLPDSSRWQ